MNWFRTILDGLAMSAVFNCCVAVFWILKPHSFIVMFPKSLQKKARPVTKEERRHTILMYATLYPAILIWMILSTYQAAGEDRRNEPVCYTSVYMAVQSKS